MPDPSDAEVEAALAAVPAAAWEALRSALAALAAEPPRAGWRDTPATLRLYDALTVAVVPFGWASWDGLARYADPATLDAAPVADAARYVTAVVRAERFSRGTFAGALATGTAQAAAERLLAWASSRRASPP